MSSANVNMLNTAIAPEALLSEIPNVYDTTTLNTMGDAIHEVTKANCIATINSVDYCPFFVISNNVDDLSITTDDLFFTISFKSGATMNADFCKLSSSVITQFTSKKSRNILLPTGQQNPSFAYVTNLAEVNFNSHLAVDLLSIPSDFITDNEALCKTAFEAVLLKYDGVVTDKNGVVVHLNGNTLSGLSVGDTISNFAPIVMFQRTMGTYPERYSDLTSIVCPLDEEDLTSHSSHNKAHHFQIQFGEDTGFTFGFKLILFNTNQTSLTDVTLTDSEKTTDVTVNLKFTA